MSSGEVLFRSPKEVQREVMEGESRATYVIR